MDYVLYITTVQSNAIRILFESLKDVLTDVNMHINSNGIKIISMDGSKSAIIHLKLLASQFEIFNCKEDMNIGINMLSLFKILKSIKNNDVISFYIDTDTTKLNIKLENKEKNTETVSTLKLLDIDEHILNIPNIEFQTILTIPSNDFQNYIRDLSIISSEIKIESNNNILTLSADGDFASQKIMIKQTDTGLTLSKAEHAIGIFNLKYLLLFTKSTNLCNNIEIYLKTNFPIIVIYNVANLGQLKFCLAPKQNT
jgi:proliferating cell nuclear antigen